METCDLCIIGAGYAGINAFNAACKYLPHGARVVVVDQQTRWGGQWVDQYDFVRLHIPHPNFTAGEREWAITKAKSKEHLATKKEIIQHFDDIVLANVNEKQLELIQLFRYEYEGHSVRDGKVYFTAKPLMQEEGVLPVNIVADRLIKASGQKIPQKLPIEFDLPRGAVHSLVASDVLTAKWTAIMKYSKDADKPIWVIGSGKTAMDVIIAISREEPSLRSRLGCIAGRGTWFLNREVLLGGVDANGIPFQNPVLEMQAMCNGSNHQEVYQEFAKRGLLHSAMPDPRTYVAGVTSKEELDLVRAALNPAAERIIKAHLVDIEESSSAGLSFKLRALDGHTIFHRPLERGSFIINCTDNYVETSTSAFEPIVSDDGLVLAPQFCLDLTGPTAHAITHAWYLGVLDGVWQKLVRPAPMDFNMKDHQLSGTGLIVNLPLLLEVLPEGFLEEAKSLQDVSRQDLPFPPGYWERTLELFRMATERLNAPTARRYTDKKSEVIVKKDVLGGNIGKHRSQPGLSKL